MMILFPLGYWIFGAEFCDTWIAFDVMCSTSSILNLCAISLDRYIHIKDPLRYIYFNIIFTFIKIHVICEQNNGMEMLQELSNVLLNSLTHWWKNFNVIFLNRYTRWVTRSVAIATIAAIWILAAFVSFVPISLGLHRPNEPLQFEMRDGQEYQMCALDLTPTYAVVSSCISFYLPCVVLVGIYCRWLNVM